MKVLVTGGAGFIGSAVCRLLVGEMDATILNIDKLTYAANLASLRAIDGHQRYSFHRADICDAERVSEFVREFDPDAILHLAAESHVDRSIDGPAQFIKTNIDGTYQLWRQHSLIGNDCHPSGRLGSAFIMSPPTRYSDRSGRPANLLKLRRISPTRHIRRRKLRPITWFAHGTKPLDFPS